MEGRWFTVFYFLLSEKANEKKIAKVIRKSNVLTLALAEISNGKIVNNIALAKNEITTLALDIGEETLLEQSENRSLIITGYKNDIRLELSKDGKCTIMLFSRDEWKKVKECLGHIDYIQSTEFFNRNLVKETANSVYHEKHGIDMPRKAMYRITQLFGEKIRGKDSKEPLSKYFVTEYLRDCLSFFIF